MKQTEKMHPDARRRQIIARSMDLFLDQGFSGTSMSTIAKTCEVTKAGLYHHFESKDDLFVACVTSGYQQALDSLEDILAQDELSATEQLTKAFEVLYETTISSSVGRMSPLIAEVSRTIPKVARSFHAGYISPQQELLWSLIEAGQASGEFRKMDRGLVFHIVFGPIVTLSLSREMFADFDDLDDHFPVENLQEGHLQVVLTMLKTQKSD